MPSAVITTELRYPAMPLAGQLDHKRFVHPGPLVLRTGPLKSPAPTTDRDRTVSRRSEPSSRTALIRSEEHTSELQSLRHLVCRLLLEKKIYTPRMTTEQSTRLLEARMYRLIYRL